MPKLPELPDLPDPANVFKIIDTASSALDKGLDLIDRVANKFDQVAEKLAPPEEKSTETTTTEETTSAITKGTACLPCSQGHLSTTSASLSEAVRFARDKGIRDPEVVRRIRIALDELNIMERIDLAPDETAKLKGKEKELADWVLTKSRDLRHTITAIRDAEGMEQAAAKASEATEEFMKRLYDIPEEECETCGEMVQKLREYIEKRKREREEQ